MKREFDFLRDNIRSIQNPGIYGQNTDINNYNGKDREK